MKSSVNTPRSNHQSVSIIQAEVEQYKSACKDAAALVCHELARLADHILKQPRGSKKSAKALQPILDICKRQPLSIVDADLLLDALDDSSSTALLGTLDTLDTQNLRAALVEYRKHADHFLGFTKFLRELSRDENVAVAERMHALYVMWDKSHASILLELKRQNLRDFVATKYKVDQNHLFNIIHRDRDTEARIEYINRGNIYKEQLDEPTYLQATDEYDRLDKIIVELQVDLHFDEPQLLPVDKTSLFQSRLKDIFDICHSPSVSSEICNITFQDIKKHLPLTANSLLLIDKSIAIKERIQKYVDDFDSLCTTHYILRMNGSLPTERVKNPDSKSALEYFKDYNGITRLKNKLLEAKSSGFESQNFEYIEKELKDLHTQYPFELGNSQFTDEFNSSFFALRDEFLEGLKSIVECQKPCVLDASNMQLLNDLYQPMGMAQASALSPEAPAQPTEAAPILGAEEAAIQPFAPAVEERQESEPLLYAEQPASALVRAPSRNEPARILNRDNPPIHSAVWVLGGAWTAVAITAIGFAVASACVGTVLLAPVGALVLGATAAYVAQTVVGAFMVTGVAALFGMVGGLFGKMAHECIWPSKRATQQATRARFSSGRRSAHRSEPAEVFMHPDAHRPEARRSVKSDSTVGLFKSMKTSGGNIQEPAETASLVSSELEDDELESGLAVVDEARHGGYGAKNAP